MKTRRALLFTLTLVLALCAACNAQSADRQLIDALIHNDAKRALALVHAGADPNTRYALKTDYNPLAALRPSDAQSFVNDSPTAFMIACGAGWTPPSLTVPPPPAMVENLSLLRAMLVHGANVNAKAEDKNTALHFAVKRGRLNTMTFLLQHGAQVNAQDGWGETPLFPMNAQYTAKVAHLLLLHGANPNAQDEGGNTALVLAMSASNAKSVASELMAHGADPNLRDKDGETPLTVAQRLGRLDLVRLLKQHGAK